MTYPQCIDYLYSRLPMFSRVGAAAYKKDLGNIGQLLAALGNPHLQFKSIHIAGTNGKGSTSHMIAAVLQEHGYNTGLYTSPHLRDFRERIKLNGEMVGEDFVVAFTEQIKPMIETIEPSFFEVTVAMAFSWFAAMHCDVAVIETGLGGRLDSTNIITPELSIITNIGWDHMDLLGDTLQKIAGEKAGIIKPGVPVVVGEMTPETAPVFLGKATTEHAPLLFASQRFSVGGVNSHIEHLSVRIEDNLSKETVALDTDLPGWYQQYNVLTTYAACRLLQEHGWPLVAEKIASGIAHAARLTGLKGRWQVLHQHPWVVADVAHNSDGLAQLLRQVAGLRPHVGEVHIIYGTSADKDTAAIFPLMDPGYRYYFTRAQLPRAMDEQLLAQKAFAAGIHGQAFPDVAAALQQVASLAEPEDLVVVCGSVFLVGEIDEEAVKTLFHPSA